MSNRKTSFFYIVLSSLASLAVGMVIAARLDLTTSSFAGSINIPAANSAPLTGTLDATTFRTIAHDQSPMVVSIKTLSRHSKEAPDIQSLPRGMRDYFGQQGQDVPVSGAGSGFIIDKKGFILTNNHVVEDADEIRVVLYGAGAGDPGLPAKIVGHDKLTDSALIQLTEMPDTPLAEATFGDSDQLAPGDWVMAIGNPFGFDHSVTVGVVSAVGRVAPELRPVNQRDLPMIQTDAAINRGNSGGPLLNVRGEVIGINTAIITEGGIGGSGGGNVGVGFAVPINTVRDVLPSLRTGKIIRGRIGVTIQAVAADAMHELGLPNKSGAMVSTVAPKGPAAVAGARPLDVVLEFNGKPVKDSSDLVDKVTRTTPGTTVPVKILRNKQTLTLNVAVEELNLDEEAGVPTTPTPAAAPAPADTGFGMKVDPLTPDVARRVHLPAGKSGAVISSVDPTGAAAQAGMGRLDVILSVNGTDVSSVDDVTRQLDKVQAGHPAFVVVWQNGQETGLTVRKK